MKSPEELYSMVIVITHVQKLIMLLMDSVKNVLLTVALVLLKLLIVFLVAMDSFYMEELVLNLVQMDGIETILIMNVNNVIGPVKSVPELLHLNVLNVGKDIVDIYILMMYS